ncbi:ribosomal large subunit pseudouridine synthase B [Gracilibacillus boraciitolerans JCM 21714]|uniref:Pseudouridine synthase n=1 Tax=Gracilibacillus boraciitolerans JCM 21714 TaxID=1298598 RepID=W4VDM8_9BACI|nr:pseudouridine synthase [Gracilibacillus boraciitolerans]GAE91317.1 ribosomal large subunit pseudouridine synthase B [Gracilibacillus boraciitolerans JCM 21714]
MERLQKVIAKSGITSRRKAETMIENGLVEVNGKVVTELGTKVSNQDEVKVEGGVPIEKEKLIYFLFYKPRGVITSVGDDKDRKTVIDYFEEYPERIYPVGRLDYETSGLLIMTNDGDFTNLLLHPSSQINKEYVMKTAGIPSKENLQLFKKGIRSEGDLLKANYVKTLSVDPKKNTAIIKIVLHQGGKNRQIRRMFEAIGTPVLKLKREKFGFLTLDGLTAGGEHRELTPKEIAELKKLAK